MISESYFDEEVKENINDVVNYFSENKHFVTEITIDNLNALLFSINNEYMKINKFNYAIVNLYNQRINIYFQKIKMCLYRFVLLNKINIERDLVIVDSDLQSFVKDYLLNSVLSTKVNNGSIFMSTVFKRVSMLKYLSIVVYLCILLQHLNLLNKNKKKSKVLKIVENLSKFALD